MSDGRWTNEAVIDRFAIMTLDESSQFAHPTIVRPEVLRQRHR
jgi:hypothetical protein